MSTINWKQFVEAVTAWGNTNEDRIKHMWPLKGGWEGWAQAEIAAYILSHNSTIDMEREQSVYVNNKKRCDLLFNAISLGEPDVIVELKCQSFYNHENFVDGLISDKEKLLKELKPTYQGSVLVVMGIYFTNEANIPNYFSTRELDNREVGICWAIDENG